MYGTHRYICDHSLYHFYQNGFRGSIFLPALLVSSSPEYSSLPWFHLLTCGPLSFCLWQLPWGRWIYQLLLASLRPARKFVSIFIIPCDYVAFTCASRNSICFRPSPNSCSSIFILFAHVVWTWTSSADIGTSHLSLTWLLLHKNTGLYVFSVYESMYTLDSVRLSGCPCVTSNVIQTMVSDLSPFAIIFEGRSVSAVMFCRFSRSFRLTSPVSIPRGALSYALSKSKAAVHFLYLALMNCLMISTSELRFSLESQLAIIEFVHLWHDSFGSKALGVSLVSFLVFEDIYHRLP